ncbi:MAG: hypothetical protein ACI9YH_003715 [Colwellia sp.]|jgi:hypothetical protein
MTSISTSKHVLSIPYKHHIKYSIDSMKNQKLQNEDYTNLLEYCQSKINEFEKKAKHNKFESLWSFKIMMISSLAIPLFVSYGTGDFWNKIFPSILSLICAFLTAWIQLRKPQQLWKLYRTSQRELEKELDLYKFNAGKYSNSSKADELLITEFTNKSININANWAKLVPSSKSEENKTESTS